MIISLTKVGTRSKRGSTSKICSSSREPPRAWARERASGVVSKLHLILRATAPVGGGDGVLSKLLLVLRVDGTHQKYSSV